MDNVVYSRSPNGEVKRSPEERILEFNKIMSTQKWIIEGVFRECFNFK